MNLRTILRAVAVVALVLSVAPAYSESGAPALPAEAQARADRIAKEIEQIRGLTYKQPVHAETQSVDDFGAYVSRQLDEEVPDAIRQHFGTIVRALGLYRGPPIEDFSAMMKAVMTSQVGAYYDPQKNAFYVVMSNMPEMMQGVMYAHELYHALQDQYFGLEKYMAQDRKGGVRSGNADRELARSAVVEGEATYIMSIWMVQSMTKKPPTREMLAQMVAMQANMSIDQLRQAIKQPEVAETVGSDMQGALDAAKEIPSFIMDSMMAVYLKGLSFVFAVQEQGWPAVEKLYAEYPPQSTEHILHPEKWLAREAPTEFSWPDFGKVAALKGWELLDEDTLGEFQWRIVFTEHGLTAQSESAAAGWSGDRYAVFKRKDADTTLLLWRTAWDDKKEAGEFADAYRTVLAIKYDDAKVPTRVVQKDADVYIVEGGDEASIDALVKLVKGVQPLKPLATM